LRGECGRDIERENMIKNTLIGLGIFPKLASLLYAIIFVLIIYVPANYLFKKKIFIKL